MLRDRLQVFASQDDVERQTGMRAMLLPALDLPGSDRRSIMEAMDRLVTA